MARIFPSSIEDLFGIYKGTTRPREITARDPYLYANGGGSLCRMGPPCELKSLFQVGIIDDEMVFRSCGFATCRKHLEGSIVDFCNLFDVHPSDLWILRNGISPMWVCKLGTEEYEGWVRLAMYEEVPF